MMVTSIDSFKRKSDNLLLAMITKGTFQHPEAVTILIPILQSNIRETSCLLCPVCWPSRRTHWSFCEVGCWSRWITGKIQASLN